MNLKNILCILAACAVLAPLCGCLSANRQSNNNNGAPSRQTPSKNPTTVANPNPGSSAAADPNESKNVPPIWLP